MTMPGYIIWGAGSHAKVVREILLPRAIPLVAVFDRSPVPPPFPDVPFHLGREGFLAWRATAPGPYGFICAIGGSHGAARREMHAYFVAHGLEPITAIHKTAYVAESARIGAGTHLLAMTFVGPEAVIGEQCIVNTQSSVDHECVLGDGAHLSAGVHLGGRARILENAFMGLNSTVLPDVTIGAGAIVGAGAVVTKDVPPGVTVVGAPARVLPPKGDKK